MLFLMERVMLVFVYLILFLALSAALTWWRISNYQRQYQLVAHRVERPRR